MINPKQMRTWKLLGNITLTIYIGIMVYFLFLADMFHRGEIASSYRYNLVPFREISRMPLLLKYLGFWPAFINVFGNVIVFIPLGFFLPFLVRKLRKWYATALLCFELTFLVEIIQLITKVGVFDVDDMILNLLGGIIGYVIFCLIFRVYVRHQLKVRRQEREEAKKESLALKGKQE